MDDDNNDWLSAAVDDEPPPEEPKVEVKEEKKKKHKKDKKAKTEDGAAEGEADGAGEDAESEKPVAEEDQYLDPDRLLLFKHWIRPRFLQYDYLYLYRHNYYDDVIDYLDQRQKGMQRDVPRAQTWAERALRTYTSKNRRTDLHMRELDDVKLVSNMKLSGTFHRYHSREYVSRRYTTLL